MLVAWLAMLCGVALLVALCAGGKRADDDIENMPSLYVAMATGGSQERAKLSRRGSKSNIARDSRDKRRSQ